MKQCTCYALRAVDCTCKPAKYGELYTSPTAKQEQGEPVAWVDLLKEAQQIVESKFLWKRFIDGTPLENDIACWMADFAQQHTTPQQRKPLRDEMLKQMRESCESNNMEMRGAFIDGWTSAEAAHGIKE